MIVFFVGTPGSGKSYEAVKKIVDNLRMGRVVCTNIDGMDLPESQEYLKSVLNFDDYQLRQKFRFLTKEQVNNFWKTEEITDLVHRFDADNDIFEDLTVAKQELICPKGCLIVIDEAHKFFNAHDWQDRNNRELGNWASTHRHEGYDLVFITQKIEKVDKQVRTLAEWTYLFKKVNFLGGAVNKKYLCFSFTGDDHACAPLSKSVRTYNPFYFPAYRSYTSADAKEVGFMAHSNVLKHPVFFAIPLVIAFVLYMFFQKSSFASGDIFGVDKVQRKHDKQVKELAQKQKPVQPSFSSSSRSPMMPTPVATGLPVAPVAAPSLLPAYAPYKVDAYIIDNGQTIIQLCGAVVRLPSPHVQSFNKISGFAVAETAFFGPSVSKN